MISELSGFQGPAAWEMKVVSTFVLQKFQIKSALAGLHVIFLSGLGGVPGIPPPWGDWFSACSLHIFPLTLRPQSMGARLALLSTRSPPLHARCAAGEPGPAGSVLLRILGLQGADDRCSPLWGCSSVSESEHAPHREGVWCTHVALCGPKREVSLLSLPECSLYPVPGALNCVETAVALRSSALGRQPILKITFLFLLFQEFYLFSESESCFSAVWDDVKWGWVGSDCSGLREERRAARWGTLGAVRVTGWGSPGPVGDLSPWCSSRTRAGYPCAVLSLSSGASCVAFSSDVQDFCLGAGAGRGDS